MKPRISITALLLLMAIACLAAAWHRTALDIRRLQRRNSELRLKLSRPTRLWLHLKQAVSHDMDALSAASPEVQAAEEQVRSLQRLVAAQPEDSDLSWKLLVAERRLRAAHGEHRGRLRDSFEMIMARVERQIAMDRLEDLNAELENIKETVPNPKSSPRYQETEQLIWHQESRLRKTERKAPR